MSEASFKDIPGEAESVSNISQEERIFRIGLVVDPARAMCGTRFRPAALTFP